MFYSAVQWTDAESRSYASLSWILDMTESAPDWFVAKSKFIIDQRVIEESTLSVGGSPIATPRQSRSARADIESPPAITGTIEVKFTIDELELDCNATLPVPYKSYLTYIKR